MREGVERERGGRLVGSDLEEGQVELRDRGEETDGEDKENQ